MPQNVKNKTAFQTKKFSVNGHENNIIMRYKCQSQRQKRNMNEKWTSLFLLTATKTKASKPPMIIFPACHDKNVE